MNHDQIIGFSILGFIVIVFLLYALFIYLSVWCGEFIYKEYSKQELKDAITRLKEARKITNFDNSYDFFAYCSVFSEIEISLMKLERSGEDKIKVMQGFRTGVGVILKRLGYNNFLTRLHYVS